MLKNTAKELEDPIRKPVLFLSAERKSPEAFTTTAFEELPTPKLPTIEFLPVMSETLIFSE